MTCSDAELGRVFFLISRSGLIVFILEFDVDVLPFGFSVLFITDCSKEVAPATAVDMAVELPRASRLW